MSKTIYIVTEGEYSDKHICAVFDDKDLAQKYIKATTPKSRWADEKEIEEWPLNENKTGLNKGYTFFNVTMYKNGESTVRASDYKSEFRFFYNKITDKSYMQMSVMAKDEKHAVKIVNEKRVQLIANNMWGKQDEQT